MRPLRRSARRALLMLCLWLAGTGTVLADAPACIADWNSIGQVCLVHDPSERVYGHDILGDVPEWHFLSVLYADPLRPPELLGQAGHVFEDIAPRLVDVTGDGFPEVIVVQSGFEQGARLAVFGAAGGELRLLASTPYIGERNRWLAPVAMADLDGDGTVELAYIDRPHLTKRLRIWRYIGGALRHVADLDGLTNHRIGWDYIAGGWRACSAEMILASADWRRVVAVTLRNGRLTAQDRGPLGPEGLAPALSCAP
ncbi:FG-GAP repeat domain-containing protein [Roseovarius sp. S4756]|uniref:FG-GAP repeat domain-containing protein n=1 Tax=Roseovarius maritimus TaxID=3342637 RepID=UPI0037266362